MSEPVPPGSSEAMPKDPDYITYLLDPEQEYNCYFVVGNPALNIPNERIGVVKKMLLAHSIVFRAELQDSKIAEKGDVPVPDMYPDTFRNMLRFTYGYDNTNVLTFDEADNLLYAAEKYMMVGLKNKLATCLMSMLSCENICTLMNNPACYKMLELNSTITEILQLETEKVLTNPQFINLSPDAFLKILEQETLNVDEIELWRSAVEWAKNRAHTDDGPTLRNELNNPLQRIRVCSLSYEDLCTEVFPTEVLTYDELKLVCQSRKSGQIQPSLTSVCNIVEERSGIKSDILTANFSTAANNLRVSSVSERETVMQLYTKDSDLEIHSVELSRYNATTHRCSGSITFDDSCGRPITVSFSEQLDVSSPWFIPSKKSGMCIRLAANKCYSMKTIFSCGYIHETQFNSGLAFSNNHFKVNYHRSNNGYYVFHMLQLKYRTVANKGIVS